MQSFSLDAICRNTSRSSLKDRILPSIHGGKLLEPSTNSKKSYSFSRTSLPINMKEELGRLWLIDRKLSSILIYYGIIELPLFWIKRRRI
jgi:hypothetical protein